MDRCETKSRMERIQSCGDESTPTGRARISYTRGFQMKKRKGGVWGRGRGEGSDLLWPLCQLSLQLFIRLQTCTLPKSGPRLQQNELVHTSGMSPSSTVQNVVQKELLHIGGVHSCRVGSLFRPRGEKLPPQLLVAERLCEGKMLSQREEKKKKSAFYMIKAGI